ncbi:MAG: hypothetical protein Q4G08_05965 [Capnocytophaga sp.]|nr:hypothetical protein [Capnocytophaga sp.]
MEFETRQIFENNEINKVCDFIYSEINDTYGHCNHLVICGSVAKIWSGILPESYQPKDLDIQITDYLTYRFLVNNLHKWFPNMEVEARKMRLILYTGFVTIEFWGNPAKTDKKKKTKNIMYKGYGNTI